MEGIEVAEPKSGNKFELLIGIVITLFAACLAISELGAGRYGDDEMIWHNEKANAFQWYNSKGIKQTLVEGQRDLLHALLESNTIREEQRDAVEKHVASLSKEIDRYKKEKKEILLGSAAVGKENWIQDVDGQLGKVIGAKELEAKGEVLGNAGDIFDYSSLFLQLSLVIGAISLVIQSNRLKYVFFSIMCALGVTGTIYAINAFTMAMKV